MNGAVRRTRRRAPAIAIAQAERVGQSFTWLRVIVESAQMVLRVTFHVGGVGRGPVSRIADVAEQMECGAAERVAAFVRTRPGKAGHYVAGPAKAGHYTPGNLHARLLVRVARAFRDRRIARLPELLEVRRRRRDEIA